MALLETRDLGITFGGLPALQHLDLSLEPREIVGLIGPNGAGKTTVFNLLTSVYPPTTGSITLDGVSIVGKKTYQITQLGIARTFQNIRPFEDISVIDNVKIAMNAQMRYPTLAGILRLPSYRREEQEVHSRAMELLGRAKPTTFPTASSAGWKLPAPWPPTPRCCCWMSPRPA